MKTLNFVTVLTFINLKPTAAEFRDDGTVGERMTEPVHRMAVTITI